MDDDHPARDDRSPVERYSMMLPTSREERLGFIVRAALAVAAVFVGLFIVWRVREAFLLVFLSIVVATVLLAAVGPIRRYTPLSHAWALTLVGVALLLLIAGVAWLLGSQISGQAAELSRQLQQAVQSLEESLGVSLPEIAQVARDAGAGASGGVGGLISATQELFGSLVSVGQAVLAAFASAIVVVIGGFFLAATPERYREGVVKLFPKPQHERIDGALRASGNALRLWLGAQLVSMAIVAVLVALGTWLIGLPAPLALGVLAGLLEFIPLLGPWLGAAPAVLLALPEGGLTVLWTVLLFLAIQQLESNLITPLVQQELVELPAALLLFSVVAMGLLFGPIGVLVAAPLTVVFYVLVKKLYVRETLGERTKVPGET